MAAVGRTGETQIVNDNIYDNNAKEITPAMVRAVMATLIESHFNLVDDFLQGLNYSSGVTLQEKFEETNPNSILASGTVVLGNTTLHTVGDFFSVTGDFDTAQIVAGNADDSLFTITLTEALATSNYMPVVAVRSGSSSYDDDDDLLVSTFKNATTTTFQVAMKKFTNNNNVTLYIKLFAM